MTPRPGKGVRIAAAVVLLAGVVAQAQRSAPPPVEARKTTSPPRRWHAVMPAWRCTFNTGALGAKHTSVTLTVFSISAPLSVYQPPANHDRAGNATGMSMTYMKP
jgi:hypothetical protein